MNRWSACSLLLSIGSILTVPQNVVAGKSELLVKTVQPLELTEPLANPYMGWGMWAGPHGFGNNEKDYSLEQNTTGFGNDAPLIDWILVDWHWAGLEPKEGQYDWKDFDALVNYWTPKNKQFVVRLWVTDDPGWNGRPGPPVLPDWIWAKGVRSREYTGNAGIKQRELDYADASYERIYLPALKRFLTAFAERYDKPGSPVILLQVMGYGHWADWATWYSHYSFPSPQAKHELLAKIMNTYIDTFKNIRLFEFAGADWDGKEMKSFEEHLYTKALDVAISNGFGLIWTGFIDGLRGWDRMLMQKYWQHNPIIAEANWNYDDMMDQRTHGTLDENLDMMLHWHSNFGHFYFVVDTYKRAIREQRNVLERGLQTGGLGYRLTPTSLSWPDELPAGHLLLLKQTWVNRNVGRLYQQHYLKLYLTDVQGQEKFGEVDTSFDESSWVQGETYPVISVFHLPKDLAPGIYDIRLALVDGTGKPQISLAIQGKDSEKRYKVGEIRMLPPESLARCDKAYCP